METDRAVDALNTFGQQSGLTTLIAEYSWLLFVGFILFFFKGVIENATTGLLIFYGNDYDEDDVVLLNGRPARIVRISITKTVFYLYVYRDGKITGGTKLALENSALSSQNIERPLPKLDSDDFFRPDEGPNGHDKEDEEDEEIPTDKQDTVSR
jgi:hypothetical protein